MAIPVVEDFLPWKMSVEGKLLQGETIENIQLAMKVCKFCLRETILSKCLCKKAVRQIFVGKTLTSCRLKCINWQADD